MGFMGQNDFSNLPAINTIKSGCPQYFQYFWHLKNAVGAILLIMIIDMKEKGRLKNILILVILISIISCDQISKQIVRQELVHSTPISVISHYVVLTKVENTGAFLGMGNSMPRGLYLLLMVILPLIAIGYGLYYIFKKNNLSMLLVAGISLIISGGLGNICDRILHGSVTDFLFFDFIIFHTGIVNIADIAVTTGFFLIMYEYLVNRKKAEKAEIEK